MKWLGWLVWTEPARLLLSKWFPDCLARFRWKLPGGRGIRLCSATGTVSFWGIHGFFAERTVNGKSEKGLFITAFGLKPKLLILDEPMNGLDFQSIEYLYQQIGSYRQYGTILFSSHILESICLTSDRAVVLEQGQIKRCFAGQEIEPEKIREVLKEWQPYTHSGSSFSAQSMSVPQKALLLALFCFLLSTSQE